MDLLRIVFQFIQIFFLIVRMELFTQWNETQKPNHLIFLPIFSIFLAKAEQFFFQYPLWL